MDRLHVFVFLVANKHQSRKWKSVCSCERFESLWDRGEQRILFHIYSESRLIYLMFDCSRINQRRRPDDGSMSRISIVGNKQSNSRCWFWDMKESIEAWYRKKITITIGGIKNSQSSRKQSKYYAGVSSMIAKRCHVNSRLYRCCFYEWGKRKSRRRFVVLRNKSRINLFH